MAFEEDQRIRQRLEVGFSQEVPNPDFHGLERGRSKPKHQDTNLAAKSEVVQTSEVQIRRHEDAPLSHGSVEDLLVRQPPVAFA